MTTTVLNDRELEILVLIDQGLTNRAIAERLVLSPETVKWYNKQIYGKLDVGSRTQAVAAARRLGLLAGEPLAAGDSTPALPVSKSQPQNLPQDRRHNLPAALTAFVGRRREIADVQASFKDARLVTLTGPGGSGKTRLALQAAAGMVEAYPDGVWFVDLSPLEDPALVPNAVAERLHVTPGDDRQTRETLKHTLAHRRLLLVLDNFEHLLPAATLVPELLSAAPELAVLVTSRERLRVYGEREYPVHPLPAPDSDREEAPEDLAAYEAVQLFALRAQAVRPDFELSGEQARAAARIAAQVDGLPLALELAAARLKLFSPAALSERLADRLGALTGGPRDLPGRQRTLRATIDWSFDLLDPEEKRLFARMAVFSGGATLEAVERICAGDLPGGALEILTELVEKNLLIVRPAPSGEPRFGMLETIRAYAWEKLAGWGETAALRQAHANEFAALAERTAPELRLAGQRAAYLRLDQEHDNLRAALAWSFGEGQIEPGLRLAAALRDYWYYRGFLVEGWRWIEEALGRASEALPRLHAAILRSGAEISFALGDLGRGEVLDRQSLALYRQLGDEHNTGWTLSFLASQLVGQPDRLAEGLSLGEEGLAILRRYDDQPGIAQALTILGELTRVAGDDVQAQIYYEEALEISERLGDRLRIGMVLGNLAYIDQHRGRDAEAAAAFRRALEIDLEINNSFGVATYLTALAGPLGALGEAELAARLLGAAQAHIETIGAKFQPGDVQEFDRNQAQVQETLGAERFREAFQSGRRLDLRDAVREALEEK